MTSSSIIYYKDSNSHYYYYNDEGYICYVYVNRGIFYRWLIVLHSLASSPSPSNLL